MKFLNGFLQAVQMLPALIMGVEGIFGKGNGKTKQQKALEMFNFSAGVAEAISQKDIVDQDAFTEAVKQINDGVVKALNASLWHNKQS